MDVDSVLLVSGLVVVLLGAALALADRRGRLLPALGALLGLLTIGWLLAARAVAVDYRDADGFTDCSFYCSAFQKAVGSALVLGPVAGVLLVVFSAVLVAARRYGPRRSS
jgi:hypothetical protein